MIIQGKKISFSLMDKTWEYIKNQKCVFKVSLSDGILEVSILYTFSEKPLTLTAEAEHGDRAEVVIYPHRIELYVNSCIEDEEWPAGNHYIDDFDNLGLGVAEDVSVNEEKDEPAVLGEFQNAEGWKPSRSVFVGDCMPYVNDGRYHVLYLKDRHHHNSKWGLGAHQWEHISTDDFANWQIHPMAVKITDPSEASVCTGSWIKDNDIEYLFYTIRPCHKSQKASVARSVSRDGYNFRKDLDFGFTLSDNYDVNTARDPKLIKTSDGLYHMIITTSVISSGRGCLLHLVSTDLDNWVEKEPLYIAPEDLDEPECPDYFELDGTYYLVFSHRGEARYMYSKMPFSDWQTPQNPHIPCEGVPKAAIFGGELIFTGFRRINGYGGTLTFAKAEKKANGELAFYKFENNIS